MDRTFAWFTKADLRQYEDKYVSIVDEQVVCADEDPAIAYDAARKRFPGKEVVMWKVPPGDTYIF